MRSPYDHTDNRDRKIERLTAENAQLREEVAELRKALIEERAMAIYNDMKNQDGWIPWVVGGNSIKQDDCRTVARTSIAKGAAE